MHGMHRPSCSQCRGGDSVLAFAGATDLAYPLMIQAWNAVSRLEPVPWPVLSRFRVMKGHLVRVFDGMLAELSDVPRVADAMTSDAIFLLRATHGLI
jgi:hypothetical protein